MLCDVKCVLTHQRACVLQRVVTVARCGAGVTGFTAVFSFLSHARQQKMGGKENSTTATKG